MRMKRENEVEILTKEVNVLTAKAARSMSSDDVKIVADMIKTLLGDFAELELTNKTTENLISTINNVVSLISVREIRSDNAAVELADASLKIVTKQAGSSSGTLVAGSAVGK